MWDRITVIPDTDEAAVRQAGLAAPGLRSALDGREVRCVIVVPGRLVDVAVDA